MRQLKRCTICRKKYSPVTFRPEDQKTCGTAQCKAKLLSNYQKKWHKDPQNKERSNKLAREYYRKHGDAKRQYARDRYRKMKEAEK